jgi:hypothetical protein
MAVLDETLFGADTAERRRWTVDEYVRLDEGGFLGGEGERFELLNGEIVRKLGQNLPLGPLHDNISAAAPNGGEFDLAVSFDGEAIGHTGEIVDRALEALERLR